MDNRGEIREFLSSRRARITPDQVGLPVYGGNRRVAGLRREEVALLAGVSAEYYTRLERGYVSGVSDGVLDALAKALRLDLDERTHLFDLVNAAKNGVGTGARPASESVPPVLQSVLDAITEAPAVAINARLDILAANHLGRALFCQICEDRCDQSSVARYIFLDPRSFEFFVDWELIADDAVALLRAEAGRNPTEPQLCALVNELSTQSEAFATRWAAHNVCYSYVGTKRFRHPVVGDLTVESTSLAAETGHTVLVYTAAANSPSAHAVKSLATWRHSTADAPGVLRVSKS